MRACPILYRLARVCVCRFRKALQCIGLQCSRDAAYTLFAELDVDGSGTLEYTEIDRALRNRLEKADAQAALARAKIPLRRRKRIKDVKWQTPVPFLDYGRAASGAESPTKGGYASPERSPRTTLLLTKSAITLARSEATLMGMAPKDRSLIAKLSSPAPTGAQMRSMWPLPRALPRAASANALLAGRRLRALDKLAHEIDSHLESKPKGCPEGGTYSGFEAGLKMAPKRGNRAVKGIKAPPVGWTLTLDGMVAQSRVQGRPITDAEKRPPPKVREYASGAFSDGHQRAGKEASLASAGRASARTETSSSWAHSSCDTSLGPSRAATPAAASPLVPIVSASTPACAPHAAPHAASLAAPLPVCAPLHSTQRASTPAADARRGGGEPPSPAASAPGPSAAGDASALPAHMRINPNAKSRSKSPVRADKHLDLSNPDALFTIDDVAGFKTELPAADAADEANGSRSSSTDPTRPTSSSLSPDTSRRGSASMPEHDPPEPLPSSYADAAARAVKAKEAEEIAESYHRERMLRMERQANSSVNSSFKRRSAVGMGPMGDGSDGWSVPNDLEVPASVLSRTGAPTVAFDAASSEAGAPSAGSFGRRRSSAFGKRQSLREADLAKLLIAGEEAKKVETIATIEKSFAEKAKPTPTTPTPDRRRARRGSVAGGGNGRLTNSPPGQRGSEVAEEMRRRSAVLSPRTLQLLYKDSLIRELAALPAGWERKISSRVLGKSVEEPASWDTALAGMAKEGLKAKAEAPAEAPKPRTLAGARWKAAGDVAQHLG